MKTSLLLAGALVLGVTCAASAQTAPAKPKPAATGAAKAPAAPTRPAAAAEPNAAQVAARANALTDNMQKALGLNPQQVEKVRQINLISVRGVESARLNHRQNVRKMAAVVDDIGQARLEALKDVLTPAQFDRYQRKREEKMGVPNVQGNQGTPPPGLPGGE